jgi:hypothetical protein
MPEPRVARPRYLRVQRARAGQQRAGKGGYLAPRPVGSQRRTQRRPLAAAVQPGMGGDRRAEQGRIPAGGRVEVRRRRGDRRLLRLVRERTWLQRMWLWPRRRYG